MNEGIVTFWKKKLDIASSQPEVIMKKIPFLGMNERKNNKTAPFNTVKRTYDNLLDSMFVSIVPKDNICFALTRCNNE